MERLNLVGREALADGGDDRNAAADRRLEGDRPPQLASTVEQFRAVLGQEGLVGGHHVLAAFEQLEHDGSCRLQPADQFNGNSNLWVVDDFGEVIGKQPGWEIDVPRAAEVLIHDACQLDAFARTPGNAIALL